MRPEAAGLNLLGHGRAWWLAAVIAGLTVVPRVAVAQQSLTLPEEAGFGSVANLSCASGTISVVSATYGANVWFVGAGNATSQLAASCNGQTSCSYPVYYWVLNDPAYGYAKNFVASWNCSGGSGGTCQLSPVGSYNVNAYYAGYYDYLCGIYGSSYCQYANSYAAAAGVHVLASGAGSCASAGLYDYYCRIYEYYGYGWDYGGYCSYANSAAASGQCSGNCGGGGGGCTSTVSCASSGKNCGTMADNCGNTLNCGSCSAPQSCGGSGTSNVCGCTPTITCASSGKNCGSMTDDCGNTTNCGSCGSGQSCQNNVCATATQIPGGSYNSMYSCNSAGQAALLGQGGIDRCVGLVGLNCDGIGSSPANPTATPSQPPGWTCDAVRHDLSNKNDSQGNPICLAPNEPGASGHQCCGFFTDAEGSYFLGAGNTTQETPTVIPGNDKGDYTGPSGERICNINTTNSTITVWKNGSWQTIANPLVNDGYYRHCATPTEFCSAIGPASASPKIHSYEAPYGWQVKLSSDYAANTSNQGQVVGPASGESRVQDYPTYLSTDVKSNTIDPDLDGRIFAISNPNGGRVKLGVSGAGSGLVIVRLGIDSMVCQRHYPNCSVSNVQQALLGGQPASQVFAVGSGICGADWCSIAGLYNLAKSNTQALVNELETISRAPAGSTGSFYQSAACKPISDTFSIPGGTVCGVSTPPSGIPHGTGGNCKALPFYQIALKHGFAWYDAYLEPGLYGVFLTSQATTFYADAVKSAVFGAANLACGNVYTALFNWATAAFQSFYSFDGHMTADTYIYQGYRGFQAVPPSGGAQPQGSLTLNPSGSTCTLTGTGLCSPIAVNWVAQGAVTSASVWATASNNPGYHALFASGLAGSSTADWIGSSTVTFELRSGWAYSGQLLASASVTGVPACNNSCYGYTCGQTNACGQTCQQGSGCTPACNNSCYGVTCGYTNGCGQVCYQGSGCTPACNNSCYGVTCGYANGCGQTCYQGSGCSVAATPQITGMQDASTYQSNQATRGGYISVYGYNLNSCTQAYLGGYQSITGIYPSGGGQQVNAYIDWYSTSPGWQALYLLCDGSWTSWTQSVWVN